MGGDSGDLGGDKGVMATPYAGDTEDEVTTNQPHGDLWGRSDPTSPHPKCTHFSQSHPKDASAYRPPPPPTSPNAHFSPTGPKSSFLPPTTPNPPPNPPPLPSPKRGRCAGASSKAMGGGKGGGKKGKFSPERSKRWAGKQKEVKIQGFFGGGGGKKNLPHTDPS